MKDAKEILFDEMESDGKGGLELTTEGILTAMEIYAKERAVWFLQQRDRTLSRFECERLYADYTAIEPF